MGKKYFLDGQPLWYCRLDLHEVTHVRHAYDFERPVVRFPPQDMQCFTEFQYLYPSRKQAVDAIIRRLEVMEDIKISHKEEDAAYDEDRALFCFFDDKQKDIFFNKLIDELHERLKRLEKQQ